MFIWYAASLWPNEEAILGVYDHPTSPDDPALSSVEVTPEIRDDQLNREILKTAELLTRLKDRVRSWTP